MATLTADEKSSLMEAVSIIKNVLPLIQKELARHTQEIYGGNGCGDGMKTDLIALQEKVKTIDERGTQHTADEITQLNSKVQTLLDAKKPRQRNWWIDNLLPPVLSAIIVGALAAFLYLIELHPIIMQLQTAIH